MIAIDHLVRKCPSEVAASMKTLYSTCSDSIAYDPNYSYDAEQNEEMEEDNEGWGSDFEEDDQQGDDDTAWKVRKSACRIINAIVLTCPGQMAEFGDKFLDCMKERFKERDQSVKIDILDSFQRMIRSQASQSAELDEDDE